MVNIAVVFRGVDDTCLTEGFDALGAGAAFATMLFAALVATPCLGVVDTQGFAMTGDIRFGEVGIRCEEGDALVGTRHNRLIHSVHKGPAAVGIDSMVACVVSHHDTPQPACLRHARSDSQHDAVAERNDRGTHVVVVIVALGDSVSPLEEGTAEVLMNEV